MCAVMKTQLLIYLLQQMGCAKSIIMSVMLRDQNIFSIKKMHVHWNRQIKIEHYIRTTIAF